MGEAQKIRDRKMRGIRSSNRTNKDDTRRTERVKRFIEDLEHHGPAGLIHIAILSKIIGKPIKIWNANSSLNSIIGKKSIESTINIEYHTNDFGEIGHWTLMHGKDPDNTQLDLNSCLFSVISSQTGLNPSELRRWTMLRIKGNLWQLADQLYEFLQLEGTNNRVALMIGGARYCGTSSNDAKYILDSSQGAKCCLNSIGHPRGHAPHPSSSVAITSQQPSRSSDDTDCVEKYSLSRPKSAFLSREDQDLIAHLMLSSNVAKNAMEILNQGSMSETINWSPNILTESQKNELPSTFRFIGKWFKNGKPHGDEKTINHIIMVLRHHENHVNDRNANVLVLTCYPDIDNDVIKREIRGRGRGRGIGRWTRGRI